MTDGEFESKADAALALLERALELAAPHVDVLAKGTGVLELEFEDGSKIVVNRHTAAREIWVAAKAGGFHFRPAGDEWRDSRDGTELFDALSRLVSAQGAIRVTLVRG